MVLLHELSSIQTHARGGVLVEMFGAVCFDNLSVLLYTAVTYLHTVCCSIGYLEHSGEIVAINVVIGIHESNIFPFCMLQSNVACRGLPLVLLVIYLNTRVYCLPFVCYRTTIVCRAIVNEYDLQVAVCLIDQRLYAP